MFSYYGSKKSIIHHYPPPKYDLIIEPFAGAASYSVMYYYKNILLVEKYEALYKIWRWIIRCRVEEIEELPHFLDKGQVLDDFDFRTEEAKLLMGLIIAKGAERPRTKPTDRVIIARPNTINYTLNKIKKYKPLIRHWDIQFGCYTSINNTKATWFIDPPYQFGGEHYKESNKNIDFKYLSNWCKSRNGQTIVCENTKADWMDFKPMIEMHGSIHKTTEAIWSNYPTAFDNTQQSLF